MFIASGTWVPFYKKVWVEYFNILRAMKLVIESRTTDNINYEVKIIDITPRRDNKISDNTVAILKFNTLNPDSLKITTRSKAYSKDMGTDIIRTSLYRTFPNTNINKTNNELTTSVEKNNYLVLSRSINDKNKPKVSSKVISA